MWPFKHKPVPPADDVHEARTMREVSTAQLRAVERRAPVVSEIGDYLSSRRAENHFGESIQITFVRRPT